MSCSCLFAGSHNWVLASQHFFLLLNCTGWICRRRRTVHWSDQRLWRVFVHTVMSWMTLHYPYKRSGGTFLRYEQGLNKLPRTHVLWGMVGIYKASTRADECLITGYSQSSQNLWSLDSTSMVADYWQCKPRKLQFLNSVLVQFCSWCNAAVH